MTSLVTLLQSWTDAQLEHHGPGACLAISGAQGLGKTTSMGHLVESSSLNIAWVGLDDFYLTQAERQDMADTVHPLFATRGPPGTHDLALALETLGGLKNATAQSRTALPRFDKPSDDRVPYGNWPHFNGTPDLILVDGWMMGLMADQKAASEPPMNPLEEEDPDGVWRGAQEDHLATGYQEFWDIFDGFLHLDAPGWEIVSHWREEQEETNLGLPRGALPEDKLQWLSRFMHFYERLTRRMLSGQRRSGPAVSVNTNRDVVSTVGF